MTTKRAPKYGMAYHTIKYWQARAYDLNLYNGIKAVGCLEGTTEQIQGYDARTIAHDAIMAARVHKGYEVRNLLETGNTRHQLIDGFVTDDGIIRNPGKFESEYIATPYYWDRVMDGFEDETIHEGDTAVSIFLPDEYERARFNLHGYCYMVYATEQGFVNGRELSEHELTNFRASCEGTDDDDDPSEPQEDDLTTSDHRTFYYVGQSRPAFTINERSDGRFAIDAHPRRHVSGAYATIERAIRAFMDAEQYWPNCWFISDHGNAHLMNLDRA